MGGDHKCPLCSATFTRPQHVGRHLRAHTGDRPYECKECPLRFARSDLLSRHVNKAHPKPDGSTGNGGGGLHDADRKNDKKGGGRLKSSPTQQPIAAQHLPPHGMGVRQHHPQHHPMAAAAIAVPVQPEQTAFQAQRMYPNHPLLQQNRTGSSSWSSGHSFDLSGSSNGGSNSYMDLATGQFKTTTTADVLAMGAQTQTAGGITFVQPFATAATPNMQFGQEQQQLQQQQQVQQHQLAHHHHHQQHHHQQQHHPQQADSTSSSPSVPSSLSALGFEASLKKRACDQCNHSKVRCDFAEPCARCSHRSMQCTYTKPPRARSLAYTISSTGVAASGTSPTQAGFSQSPTSAFNPASGSPLMAAHNDFHQQQRRSSVPATASHFLTSDALFGMAAAPNHRGSTGGGGRPPVPDPQWVLQGTQSQGVQVASTGGTSTLGGGQFVSQSPTSGPIGLTLTPTLTSSTSPTTTDSTDRRGSSNSVATGSWNLPPSVLNNGDSAFAFMNGFAPSALNNGGDQNALSNATQGNPQFMWPNVAGGFDPGMLPTDSAIAGSEDEETPPGSNKTGQSDSLSQRRRSSGIWASALQQMRLEDSVPTMPTVEQNVPTTSFQYHNQRHPTFPLVDSDMTPGANRMSSSSDVRLWKYFLDPMALATPEKLHDIDPVGPATPRGLSKSNSMPDLTTPPTASAMYSSFPDSIGGVTQAADAAQENQTAIPSAADDMTLNRWKDQIQQRHASFSMKLDPEAGVRTKQLTNATFASSTNRLVRPPVHILHSAALEQTLAPERTPSFGTPAFDMNGAILTPGGVFRTPKTPNKLFNLYAAVEVRPGNKRQASQTLLPDTQKRSTMSAWADDEVASDDMSGPSSRRSSGAAHAPGSALQTSWVPADGSRVS